MEEFEQVDVVFLLPEVLLEEVVDRRLEHERIVDSNVADVFLPARVSVRSEGGLLREREREREGGERTTRYQHD